MEGLNELGYKGAVDVGEYRDLTAQQRRVCSFRKRRVSPGRREMNRIFCKLMGYKEEPRAQFVFGDVTLNRSCSYELFFEKRFQQVDLDFGNVNFCGNGILTWGSPLVPTQKFTQLIIILYSSMTRELMRG